MESDSITAPWMEGQGPRSTNQSTISFNILFSEMCAQISVIFGTMITTNIFNISFEGFNKIGCLAFIE